MTELKSKQQRLRRYNAQHDSVKELCKGLKIANFNTLLLHSDQIDELMTVLKAMKKLKKKTNEMVRTGELRLPTLVDDVVKIEPDMGLYNELKKKYTATAAKQFKFEHESKSQFVKHVFNENVDLMRIQLRPEAISAIHKLRSEIDISNYSPAQSHHDRMSCRDTKTVKAKIERITAIQEVAYEQEDAEDALKPKTKPKPKPKRKKPKAKKAPEPDSDSDNESDSDIECYLENANKDKDTNSKPELADSKKQITKLWNKEILESLESNDYECEYDGDFDEAREDAYIIESVIDDYVGRTKRQTRGRYAEVGVWAQRNPASLKKIITSIVTTIQRNNK